MKLRKSTVIYIIIVFAVYIFTQNVTIKNPFAIKINSNKLEFVAYQSPCIITVENARLKDKFVYVKSKEGYRLQFCEGEMVGRTPKSFGLFLKKGDYIVKSRNSNKYLVHRSNQIYCFTVRDSTLYSSGMKMESLGASSNIHRYKKTNKIFQYTVSSTDIEDIIYHGENGDSSTYYLYYSDSTLKVEEPRLYNKKHGQTKFYNTDGSLLGYRLYREGVLVLDSMLLDTVKLDDL